MSITPSTRSRSNSRHPLSTAKAPTPLTSEGDESHDIDHPFDCRAGGVIRGNHEARVSAQSASLCGGSPLKTGRWHHVRHPESGNATFLDEKGGQGNRAQ